MCCVGSRFSSYSHMTFPFFPFILTFSHSDKKNPSDNPSACVNEIGRVIHLNLLVFLNSLNAPRTHPQLSSYSLHMITTYGMLVYTVLDVFQFQISLLQDSRGVNTYAILMVKSTLYKRMPVRIQPQRKKVELKNIFKFNSSSAIKATLTSPIYLKNVIT